MDFKRKEIKAEKISAGEINGSSINGMTVGADIISVNNTGGHFEIGDEIGISKELELEKYKIKIVGGIIVGIKEK